ncbi:APC family permease [Saccharopolyspora shandongensis]|uniref:APC family permease n=1 Tax=Saccharopolyspora shandongensis TaxID=418495 RepID=UPI0033EA27BC
MSASSPRHPDGPTTPESATPQAVALPKILGVGDGIAIALSNISPVLSIGIGLGSIAAAIGVPGLPAVFLLAFPPIAGIALAYAKLNAHDHNCGAAYAWVGNVLGPLWGYLIGWIILATNIIFLAYATPLAGDYGLQTLASFGVDAVANLQTGTHQIVGTVVGVVLLAGLAWLATRGVDICAKYQKVLVIIEFSAVAFFCGLALLAGEKTAFSWSWFSPAAFPSPSVLATGLVLSVYMFWGWEAAFGVTEETTDKRTSSRVGFATLLIVLALFLFASVSIQRATTPDELVQHGLTVLPYIGGNLAGPVGAAVATGVLFLCIVSCIQSVLIGVARQALAMARDGVLGPTWAKLHPKRMTPARGTVIVGLISAALAFVSLALGTVSTIIIGSVTAVGILVSFYYALTGIASAVHFFPRAHGNLRTLVAAVIVPLLSAFVLACLGAYLAYVNWNSADSFAFDAANGRFLTVLPIAILVLGIPLALWKKYVRKSPHFRPGNGREQATPPLPTH